MSPPIAGEILIVDFIDILKRNEESEKRLFNFNLLQKCKDLKKDFKNPDDEKYPLFKKAIPQKFIIEKGDTLFIPPGWWHYIEYTSSGYGISIKTFPNNIKYLLKGIYNIIFVLTIDSILHTLMPTIWDRFKNRKFQV